MDPGEQQAEEDQPEDPGRDGDLRSPARAEDQGQGDQREERQQSDVVGRKRQGGRGAAEGARGQGCG
jgi:hypothetical protein